ncbi:MAG: hypothetical protein K6A41_03370 [Bacteroidales bacterium]|nr:hypothetical protein [Bacteroidales bacterium]
MKKIRIFIPILLAVIAVFTFSQCKKNHDCTMHLECYYSDNGIDTGDVCSNVHIVVGKEEYADYARADGYTDANGVFEHIFPYPALLDVVATKADTIWNEEDSTVVEVKYYTGAAQVQVNDGETTSKTILMVRTY